MGSYILNIGTEEEKKIFVKYAKNILQKSCITKWKIYNSTLPIMRVITADNYKLQIETNDLSTLKKIRQIADNTDNNKKLDAIKKARPCKQIKNKIMTTKKATLKKITAKKVTTKKATAKKRVVKKVTLPKAKVVKLKKEVATDRKKITALTRKLKVKTKKLSKIRRTAKTPKKRTPKK